MTRRREDTLIADNRKAGHDYHLLETFEAGVVLQGTEVKAMREGRAQLREATAASKAARRTCSARTSASTAMVATPFTIPSASASCC